MPLKIDYKNDVFTGNRKYMEVNNSDGSKSFIDVTDYSVDGDNFGAGDINTTNIIVNEVFGNSRKAFFSTILENANVPRGSIGTIETVKFADVVSDRNNLYDTSNGIITIPSSTSYLLIDIFAQSEDYLQDGSLVISYKNKEYNIPVFGTGFPFGGYSYYLHSKKFLFPVQEGDTMLFKATRRTNDSELFQMNTSLTIY